jgi:hypothetical protein
MRMCAAAAAGLTHMHRIKWKNKRAPVQSSHINETDVTRLAIHSRSALDNTNFVIVSDNFY